MCPMQGACHEDGTLEEGDSDGDESVATTLPGEPEDHPITDGHHAWEIMRDASCIVGMHPDQVCNRNCLAPSTITCILTAYVTIVRSIKGAASQHLVDF